MLLRILGERLVRRRVRVVVAVIAVLLGATIASSLIDISLDVSEKMSRELRSYGANILVQPKPQTSPIQIGGVNYAPLAERDYLNSSQLGRIKTIFWRHNIVGFTPYLYGVVEVNGRRVVLAGTWFERDVEIPGSRITLPNGTTLNTGGDIFTTGVKSIEPWWRVEGEWVEDKARGEAIVGESLAQVFGLRVSGEITVEYEGRSETLKVRGIVATGGFEDQQIFVTLEEAQRILELPNVADKVLVSALVKPDDELARKPHERMTPQEHETWYCSPYIGAVTYQIEEVIENSTAKPIRQISETEGKILNQTQLVFLLIAISALSASALGVASTMVTAVFERRREIGLMKALGAEDGQIALQFFTEASIIGGVGGLSGYLLGNFLAQLVGEMVFGTAISTSILSLPLTLAISIGVALLGSLFPVRGISAIEPAMVLKGE